MSYEDTEKSWEGTINIYISRTNSLEIYVGRGDDREIFRANLVPLFTFMKQQLKNVDWNYISKSRAKKWGYKRLEEEELFDMLNDRRNYDDNR